MNNWKTNFTAPGRVVVLKSFWSLRKIYMAGTPWLSRLWEFRRSLRLINFYQ